MIDPHPPGLVSRKRGDGSRFGDNYDCFVELWDVREHGCPVLPLDLMTLTRNDEVTFVERTFYVPKEMAEHIPLKD